MSNTDKCSDNHIPVIINNKEEIVEAGTSIEKILIGRGITKRAAVWINGSQLLLAEYPTTIVHANDRIKILRIVAGG